MRVIGIDPSSTATGWAAFDRNRLQQCGTIRCRTGALEMIPKVHDFFRGRGADIVLIEVPGYRWKGKISDVVKVAMIAGACTSAVGSHTVQLVEPKAWKGTVEKSVMTARILKHLDDYERAVAEGADHNAIDAVGLALWHLGRL